MEGPVTVSNVSVETGRSRDVRDSRNASPSRYGPKESQSGAQGGSDQLPATWQERLSGRLAQDSRGHMRCVAVDPQSRLNGGILTIMSGNATDSMEVRQRSSSAMPWQRCGVRPTTHWM